MTDTVWRREVMFEADTENPGMIRRVETRDYSRVENYETAEKIANDWNVRRAADPQFEPLPHTLFAERP